jgi:hypothetical protein
MREAWGNGRNGAEKKERKKKQYFYLIILQRRASLGETTEDPDPLDSHLPNSSGIRARPYGGFP